MANTKKENGEEKKTASKKKSKTLTTDTKTKKTPVKKVSSTTKKTTTKKITTIKKFPTKKVTVKEVSVAKSDKKPQKQILEVTEIMEKPKKITKEDELAKTVILEDLFKIERKNAVNTRLVVYLIVFALAILAGGFCYIYDFLKEENKPVESYNLDEYFDEDGNLKKGSENK